MGLLIKEIGGLVTAVVIGIDTLLIIADVEVVAWTLLVHMVEFGNKTRGIITTWNNHGAHCLSSSSIDHIRRGHSWKSRA